MKNIILLFGICILLFFACRDPQDIYYRLDHDQWFLYEQSDTLIFRNNDTITDAYIIGDISNYFVSWGDDLNLHNEQLDVDYDMLNECNNCPIGGFRRNYYGVGFYGDLYQTSLSYDDPTTEYTLGDTVLQNVYIMENLPVDPPRTIVKAIYYNDIFGIIRYDMYDDEMYELLLK